MESESVKPFCVFKCGEESGVINFFTGEKLDICKEILNARVSLKLKYNAVILPDAVDNIHGYHSKCYKYFVSIKKAHLEEYRKPIITSIAISDTDSNQASSRNSSGKSGWHMH